MQISLAKITCFRKLISSANSLVFFGKQYNWAFLRACKTLWILFICFFIKLDQMMISSIYTWYIFPISSSNVRIIYCWCVAGAFVPPMGITVHLYMLKRVLTAVSIILSE